MPTPILAKVDLSSGAVVAALFQVPEVFVGLSHEALADLTFADMPGFGLFPVVEEPRPAFDAATERLADEVAVGAFDREAGLVAGVWSILPLTDAEIAARNPVPASVSAAQACLILEDDGLLAGVEAIVAQMPKTVQIWFARANTWERDNPYVRGIGLELGLTEAQMDEMFRRAARRL